MVKNPPARQDTQVQSLGREDPLEKEMAATPVFLPGESHGQRSLGGLQSIALQRAGHNRSDLACMHASSRYYAHCKQFTKIDIIQRMQSSELEIFKVYVLINSEY